MVECQNPLVGASKRSELRPLFLKAQSKAGYFASTVYRFMIYILMVIEIKWNQLCI